MHEAKTLARFATGIAAVVAAAACALPAAASASRPPKGKPSAAAIAAWSASYRAKENVYRAQLAAQARRSSLPSPTAVQAWSDDYRAMWDVYQQHQLAQAQREAAAFNFSDAVVGGGIVLALGALGAAGFYVVRNRRLDTAAS
jgi:hypothetical protein